jgi:hypothetical protein
MPAKSVVKQHFLEMLTNQAPARIEKAAKVWDELTLGFYFQDENVVDANVNEIVLDCEEEDGTIWGEQVRDHIAQLVNTSTTVKSAIDIVWLASFQPIPTIPE